MSDAAANDSAPKGKIGRLPFSIREELNQRLLDGQTGRKILAWLNANPDVKRVLDEDFEGLLVSDQNLSEWRKLGFAKWLRRRERLDATKELAHHAVKLGAAGGGTIADGAAAIASGKALELLEVIADAETVNPDEFIALVTALEKLRGGDNKRKLAELKEQDQHLDREKLKRLDEQIGLERAKFQRTTCELFLKWRDNDRARAIADGPGTSEEKTELLGREMFGDLWQPAK